jgi:hypothetical protein
MSSLRILSFAVIPLLAACGRVSPPPELGAADAPFTAASAPAAHVLGPAIREALGDDSETRYFDAAVDLNKDGKQEVVVYAAGRTVCGTGGCPIYVFTPSAEGYRPVGRISVARPPVRVSPRSAHGWRNLIVGVAGGGISAGSAELEFDGAAYASNPTMPPARPVESLAGAAVLIPDFESYTEGKPVPPPVLGDATHPVAGSVLGIEIRTQDAEELRYYVLRQLTDRYAAERGIEVTQGEREAYANQMRKAMESDPNLRDAAEESKEDRAAHEEIAGAFIRQWKINKALYEHYGGRIVFQQGGPEPLDAYRKFLEESRARGDFEIVSGPLETAFWRYYRDDAIHSFFPPGSPEEQSVFAVPPRGSGRNHGSSDGAPTR